jgi:hypothetical protein
MPSGLELIDTVVVVILENRSFDHTLGYLNLPSSERIPLEGLQSDPACCSSMPIPGSSRSSSRSNRSTIRRTSR